MSVFAPETKYAQTLLNIKEMGPFNYVTLPTELCCMCLRDIQVNCRLWWEAQIEHTVHYCHDILPTLTI